MSKKILSSVLAALALTCGVSASVSAYPIRPDSARVAYELWYFPVRVVSLISAWGWDIPTAAFQDGIKGSIGGTHMVARNLGNEGGTYEMIAGGMTGGPVGAVAGALFGVTHGFFYGARHGFVGYPSPHSGSHSMLFQGRQYVVPYDDDY